MEKHFLIGLGLHNITGQKAVVEVLNKFGHSISYSLACDIETSQAENCMEKSKQTSILPLYPEHETESVLTYFWVDNFDVIIDKQRGGGALNITMLMPFQEGTNDFRYTLASKNERPISRKLEIDDNAICYQKVNTKAVPPNTDFEQQPFVYGDDIFTQLYLLWVYVRKQNSFDQIVPSLCGLMTKVRSSKEIEVTKTVETYLPPMNSKVTEFTTIQRYFEYLTELSATCNMPYVNTTLDVGAAINAYKFQWNHPDQYQKIMIHLGTFHFMKENFKVMIIYLSFIFV